MSLCCCVWILIGSLLGEERAALHTAPCLLHKANRKQREFIKPSVQRINNTLSANSCHWWEAALNTELNKRLDTTGLHKHKHHTGSSSALQTTSLWKPLTPCRKELEEPRRLNASHQITTEMTKEVNSTKSYKSPQVIYHPPLKEVMLLHMSVC